MESAQETEMTEPGDKEKPSGTNDGPYEPDLKLPDWIKPDPVAGGKGKLLYIEEWAYKRRFEDWFTVPMGFFVMLLGFGLIVILLSSIGSNTEDGFASAIPGLLIFLLYAAIPIGGGYLLMLTGFRSMPLTIWENGITQTYVSLGNGKKRMEVFIPWKKVESVNYTSTTIKEYELVKTSISTETDGIISFPGNMTFDIYHVLSLLDQLIPEKVDSEIKRFVGEEIEFRTSPLMMKKTRNYEDGILFCFIIFIIALVSTMFWRMIEEGFDLSELIPLFVLSAIPIIFTYMLISFSDNFRQRDLIERSTIFRSEGIIIPRSLAGMCTKHIRTVIPWSIVREVRLKLNLAFYSHEGEIELVNGDRYRIPLDVYQRISELSGFTKDGHDFHNQKPSPDCESIIRWSVLKLIFFIGLLLLPFMFPIAFEWIMVVFISLFIIAGLVIMILLLKHPDELENSSKIHKFYEKD